MIVKCPACEAEYNCPLGKALLFDVTYLAISRFVYAKQIHRISPLVPKRVPLLSEAAVFLVLS